MSEYLIHLVWFVVGAGYGIYMYNRGSEAGAIMGINTAVIYLSMHGKTKVAEDLISFIKREREEEE